MISRSHVSVTLCSSSESNLDSSWSSCGAWLTRSFCRKFVLILVEDSSILDTVVLLYHFIRFFASGGAAVNVKVMQFFEDVGFPICEGYGLTETCKCLAG